MLGTMVITVMFREPITIKNAEHSKFMSYRDDLERKRNLFIVLKDSHVTLNYRHVVSIEWAFND